MLLSTTRGTADIVPGSGVTGSGTTADRSTQINSPQFSASYNRTLGYAFADAASSASFAGSDVTSDTTAPNKGGTVIFSKSNSSIFDYLALYKIGVTTSSIRGSGYTEPRFAGIGAWQHTIVNGGIRQTRLNYFGYGPLTPASSIPVAGTIKYSIFGSGNFAEPTDLWFMSAVRSIEVNFSTKQVSGEISLSGENLFTGGFGGLGQFVFSTGFSGNPHTASFVNPNVNTGRFFSMPFTVRIGFFGPNAEEILITLVATDANRSIVGAFVGFVDPFAL
jgi:hypothetical protein